MSNIETIQYDAIIVGGGGSGLRAALELSKTGYRVAVVSKVFPTRSHTVAAQGGINAALGNVHHDDDWRWHMYDTIVGSDFLGDQDAVEFMCQSAPQAVIELEHMGLPFSRDPKGKIYQRAFGGQTRNYGGELASRTCCAADRTGHAMLHTLYQQNVASNTTFLNEWFAIDFILSDDHHVCGISAIEIETGKLYSIISKAVVLATGGAGKIFASSTNAASCTGDGVAMVARAGFGLQDMEMWQFHPTGLYGVGLLISEGTRGEGGYLINSKGERFMQTYAPLQADLSCRDVVARSSMLEIKAGRGCGPLKDHVMLKLNHLPAETFEKKLPGITELAITYLNIDPRKDPLPVVPTCHYMMGGIPTNRHTEVIDATRGQDRVVKGLYAIGECACVSVHGANRLGANSLLDLIVFGKACGLRVSEYLKIQSAPHANTSNQIHSIRRYNRCQNSSKGISVAEVRSKLQSIMQEDFGVFRDHKSMASGLKSLQTLKQDAEHMHLEDKSEVFNTARLELLECENMIEVAIATAISAFDRKESRGAHSRIDYPERNDEKWHKHIIVNNHSAISYRNVNMKPLHEKPILLKSRDH